MKMKKDIIDNIYIMMCYAWNVQDIYRNANVGKEPFDNVHDLLAYLLIFNVKQILKQGLYMDYDLIEEELACLKGKINFRLSMKNQSLKKNKLFCSYDIYIEDECLNQIIKSSIDILLKDVYLCHKLKKELFSLKKALSHISYIELNEQAFKKIHYNKNNTRYRYAILICEFILTGMIVKNKNNEYQFLELISETKMSRLFEKFILNFYKKHLDKNIWNVHRQKYKWKLDDNTSDHSLELLPMMEPDVIIDNLKNKSRLIIDTKYYENALVEQYYGNKKKVRSDHLYQVYSYLSQNTFMGNKQALLLYPTVYEEIHADFPIQQNHVFIRTINLNTNWKNVREDLLNIINDIFKNFV